LKPETVNLIYAAISSFMAGVLFATLLFARRIEAVKNNQAALDAKIQAVKGRFSKPDEYGLDASKDYTRVDNEFWDGTDGAHPAWWRGEEYGSMATANALKRIAEQGRDSGCFGGREVEEAAQAILKLRNEKEVRK
jgi:hypothetical protein